MSDGLRDYRAWHRAYDDAGSGLSWRLRTVQAAITAFLDERAGPLRIVSSCAGDGRDVIGVLAARADAARVRVTLLEIDPVLAGRAGAHAAAAGVDAEVRACDAGRSVAYRGAVPADLVLLVGIFGNISHTDVVRTIAAAPQLCAPGARLLWSRGRGIDGDRNDAIRGAFAAAGFAELDYATFDAANRDRPAVGVMQYDGEPRPLLLGERWFRFVR